jgi:predicted nuclease of predicted toxin-antitoxin system
MLLLFDQNISFRIKKLLESSFPNCKHLSDFGLINKSDKEIWDFAKKNSLTIVSFDADFYDFSIIWNHPPKIIWVRTQNQTTQNLYELLHKYEDSVKDFLQDQSMACLEIIHRE